MKNKNLNIYIGDIIRAMDDSPALFVYFINTRLNKVYTINLYNSSEFCIFTNHLDNYEKINQACLDEIERFYFENVVSSYLNEAKLNCLLNENICK